MQTLINDTNTDLGTTSRSCAPLGDGICDGYFGPDGDLWCHCECHDALDLPQTISGVRDWHDALHAEESITMQVRIALARALGTAL